ncbi:hypothetical protein Cs7R123_20300 [Catellatospora sp. TT07R-123]|uniref:hypothetical protein n=1 Tax=Catellatospora sp. TT07R-123 TaxID=2733863 RepID=UPI001B041C8B|nr:hypothetical protein [Catellatospora sp. TT07R-123]GHJ44688.1 hypothetical protein Cs7R123_20300 [Catellatospora sp. TT07R-123]
MIALTRLRLLGFVRTGRAVAPLIAAAAALSILYGGGQARAAEAYGVSALVLFPLLAWQTKILLDVEPDVQRRLAVVTVGSPRRELAAGLLAAGLAGLSTVALAMAAPWIAGALKPDDGSGTAIGLVAHLLALPPAVALGGLASRAVTRGAGNGAAVLVTGSVLAIVLGLKTSPMQWLVPPLMAATRLTTAEDYPGSSVLAVLGQAALWSAAALWAYARLRRHRV